LPYLSSARCGFLETVLFVLHVRFSLSVREIFVSERMFEGPMVDFAGPRLTVMKRFLTPFSIFSSLPPLGLPGFNKIPEGVPPNCF